MIDWISLIKYLFEGLAVAIAAYLIPTKKIQYTELILISLTASAMFAILDVFSPFVAISARRGSGFAIGYNQVGMGQESICQTQNGTCTYDPNVSKENLETYICKDNNGQCTPVKACQLIDKQCQWTADSEKLPDANGRECTMINDICQLKIKDTPTTDKTVEGFVGFPTNP